jgi:AraC-like DNA-binding protein
MERITHKQTSKWVFQKNKDNSLEELPELTMCGYHHVRQAASLEEHRHPESYEFVFVERGKASWNIQGEVHTTRAGDVLHTSPGERHMGQSKVIEPCRFWWFILKAPHDRGWLRLSAAEALTFAERLEPLPRVVAVGMQPIAPLLAMKDAILGRSPLRIVQTRHALLELLLIFLRPQLCVPIPEDLREILGELTGRMDADPEWHPSVDDLAVLAGISPSHFYRVFREYTGETPMAYMQRNRIAIACRRLAEQEVSVTRLAQNLGFQSSQHFATVFRRLTGSTPSAWREAHPDS